MDKFFHAAKKGEKYEVSGDFNVELGGKKLNGIFAEWNWNGEKLTLTNDRYGFYPIYYAENESGFAVSGSIRTLLALGFSPALDETAFAVFLRFSSYLAQDTP
ncbi:MAG: asparagine synthetase B family protein, partial [Acidobacteriota bacterium]|nr:asparagine synthetase B family protein [Acidobacteriota bacterium]